MTNTNKEQNNEELLRINIYNITPEKISDMKFGDFLRSISPKGRSVNKTPGLLGVPTSAGVLLTDPP
jgi:hypothetical protein